MKNQNTTLTTRNYRAKPQSRSQTKRIRRIRRSSLKTTTIPSPSTSETRIPVGGKRIDNHGTGGTVKDQNTNPPPENWPSGTPVEKPNQPETNPKTRGDHDGMRTKSGGRFSNTVSPLRNHARRNRELRENPCCLRRQSEAMRDIAR
jgi:hypothetical protein